MTQTNAKTEVTLEIGALTYGPYGIGRHNGKAIMVPYTAPGDKVLARIVESKDRYDIAELVQLIDSSSTRQIPPCPYAGECGGCSWQQVGYASQLNAKEQSVDHALRRIGKLQGYELRPIIPSPKEYHYRRRISLQCDSERTLGLFHAFSHDLIAIDSCLIADEKLNEIIAPLRSWIKKLTSPMEHAEIVAGDEPGEIVVVGKLSGEFVSHDDGTCKNFLEQNSTISGLILYRHNWRRTWGVPTISVVLKDETSLNVDADAFTQANPAGNRLILRELLASAEFSDDDRLLELYCGAGNFTIPLAKRVREIVAVEGARFSVESGRKSAQMNRVGNIHWICSAVTVAVKQLQHRRESFSKIVLDPPRAGAKEITGNLVSFAAEKIVYVSCNPTTLARDAAALNRGGYRLSFVQPIDMFPQTFHVEALAVMTRS